VRPAGNTRGAGRGSAAAGCGSTSMTLAGPL
jgi:hypothetical protein